MLLLALGLVGMQQFAADAHRGHGMVGMLSDKQMDDVANALVTTQRREIAAMQSSWRGSRPVVPWVQ
jgi:hypothetical protein